MIDEIAVLVDMDLGNKSVRVDCYMIRSEKVGEVILERDIIDAWDIMGWEERLF